MSEQRISIEDVQARKTAGEKIIMLTAYDYLFATYINRVPVDMVLVGDSLANVVLGLPSTRDVGMDVMIHHAQAVSRAIERALIVGDMPYDSFQTDEADPVASARRYISEAGCHAVKVEWFDRCLDVVKAIIADGIPVMGHVGLTPQTAEQLGGFKVQGKDAGSAQAIMHQALGLEQSGCFSLVLECVPDALAELITQRLSIPVIGIGAGPHCDGQVLVTHDLLGLNTGRLPKFVKTYAPLGEQISSGLDAFVQEVKDGKFPDAEHSYSMKPEELRRINIQ